jgi:hypothetical protein
MNPISHTKGLSLYLGASFSETIGAMTSAFARIFRAPFVSAWAV